MARIEVEIKEIKPATPSADDYRLRKVIWFALANLLAFAIAGGVFLFLMFGLAEGRGFDRAMDAVLRFLGSHMALAALAAATPFFASLLVGQYEMRRGRARRKRREAEERRRQIEADLAADRARRAARHGDLAS